MNFRLQAPSVVEMIDHILGARSGIHPFAADYSRRSLENN